jgi:beta-lactamase class A
MAFNFLTTVYIVLILFIAHACIPKNKPNNELKSLLLEEMPLLATILEKANNYEIQIIYTRIDRKKNGKPEFITYAFNLDSQRYFYPASTVKFPISLMALEKLNELNIPLLRKESIILTDSSLFEKIQAEFDSTAENGLPSIAHYIRKIMIVSDNDAFNRLYEFLGQEYIFKALSKKGYLNTRINHRLAITLSEEQNRATNSIRFIESGEEIYQQAPAYNTKPYPPIPVVKKGIGYLNGDTLINEPFDFSTKNFFSLSDQHQMLKALFFPEYVDKKKVFNLSDKDYQFLYRTMSELPTQSNYPPYKNDPDLYDAYCKFLMYGSERDAKIPSNIKIFNKIGVAYGTVTDNAYIIDTDNGVEFLLSATILCNENGIFNDGKYEYESIAYPFMRDLGKAVYFHELKRKKKYLPDFSRFNF